MTSFLNELTTQFPQIKIKNPTTTSEKLAKLRADGRNHLMVVTDFDSTLSRHLYNGKRMQSSYNILEQSRFVPENLRTALMETKNFYYPIEIDPKLSRTEKLPYMVEWWTKAHDFVCQSGLNKSNLPQIISESNAQLKTNCAEMLQKLTKSNIPIFIISAGNGNVIDELLRQKAGFNQWPPPGIKMVSNFCHFDENGIVSGHSQPLIHTYNKGQLLFPGGSYALPMTPPKITMKSTTNPPGANDNPSPPRQNCLLLGDMVGDIEMTHSVKAQLTSQLSIGFLNDRVDDRLHEHMATFDIVLCQDESMDVPLSILDSLLTL